MGSKGWVRSDVSWRVAIESCVTSGGGLDRDVRLDYDGEGRDGRCHLCVIRGRGMRSRDTGDIRMMLGLDKH